MINSGYPRGNFYKGNQNNIYAPKNRRVFNKRANQPLCRIALKGGTYFVTLSEEIKKRGTRNLDHQVSDRILVDSMQKLQNRIIRYSHNRKNFYETHTFIVKIQRGENVAPLCMIVDLYKNSPNSAVLKTAYYVSEAWIQNYFRFSAVQCQNYLDKQPLIEAYE